MAGLVRHAITTAFEMNCEAVFVEASIPARGLFEKLGFELVCEQKVNVGSELLTNYRMRLNRPNRGRGGKADDARHDS
ncbi:hypothetical protein Hsar01_01216 [Haloferula sargassicola]|uniref:N-acetyltransferase domain-containing protein n=2 Tax=Haloferula sargassicola TaxID=490096 RepID=A0ABP9UMT7_9BACT